MSALFCIAIIAAVCLCIGLLAFAIVLFDDFTNDVAYRRANPEE